MLWRCLCVFLLVVSNVFGHGDPSVAALASRDVGERLVVRFNLDLEVFFKGRVAPDWKWVSEQSEEDLELLRGDLDGFLRELYVFSEPGRYSFPMLGGDPEVEREIAPGIALPDGHVMPVFISDEPPEAAVWVSASAEAVPLALVKQVDGKRDRRAVILFPGEEREVFPAVGVEPLVLESGLDPGLFPEPEMNEMGPSFRDRFVEGWQRMLSLEAFSVWLFILALGCASRSHLIFWGCVALLVFSICMFHAVDSEVGFGRLMVGFWGAVVALLGMLRGRSYLLGVWFLLLVVMLSATGVGAWAFSGFEGRDWAMALGIVAGIVLVAVLAMASVGWLWQKEKTPRWLATWGGGVLVLAVVVTSIWLRPS